MASEHMEVVENEELDLYTNAPYQTEILKRETIAHNPIQSTYDSTIQFDINNSQHGKYVDLANTTLEVEVGIRKRSDKSPLAKDKKVAPINILFHSMFKNVTVTLGNGTVINESNDTYPYIAYFQTLLHDSDYLKTQGELILWEKDDEESMSDTAATATKIEYATSAVTADGKVTSLAVESNALARRQARWFTHENPATNTYHPWTLIGRPIGPLFQQERFLPYGIDIKIQFDRSKSDFVLMNGEAEDYDISIEKIELFVDYVTVNDKVFNQDINRTKDIVIPVTRPVVQYHNIGSGTSIKSIDLFRGKLPTRMILAYVKNSAQAGEKDENPFNFQTFGLNKLVVRKNGDNYPMRPYEPDFSKLNYQREYMALFEMLGMLNKSGSITISYKDFVKGFAIFCFDFTGEGKNGMADENTKHVGDQGSIVVENKFKTALVEEISLVVYAEFENDITIDPKGNVDKGF